jgi:hypothetical protein
MGPAAPAENPSVAPITISRPRGLAGFVLQRIFTRHIDPDRRKSALFNGEKITVRLMDQSAIMVRVRHLEADSYISAIIGFNEVKLVVQDGGMICP